MIIPDLDEPYCVAVDIIADGVDVTVSTGDVTKMADEGVSAIHIAAARDANVTFSSGDITSEGGGIDVLNVGGDVTATTGDINSSVNGVWLRNSFDEIEDNSENENDNKDEDKEPPTGSTTVTVNGDITLEGEGGGFGVWISSEVEDIKDRVIVNGEINVDIDGYGCGISVETDGDATVEANDNITVNGVDADGIVLNSKPGDKEEGASKSLMNLNEMEMVNGGNPLIIIGLLAVEFGLFGYLGYEESK